MTNDVITADAAMQSVDTTPVMYCANHPETETLLRCNRCNKPICVQCAVQTPVGYRCRECVREQQNVYYTATRSDDLVALGVSFVVALVATPIVGFFLAVTGWFSWIIAFLAGGAAGSILAQIIRGAVGRRRSRAMRWFALSGLVVGMLVGSAVAMAFFHFNPLVMPSVWIFTGLAIASALPFLR